MGTAELSCVSLKALAHDKQFQIAAVVTQPDRPKGRDLKEQASPVKTLAWQLGLPVFQPVSVRDVRFIAGVCALQPDLIVVAAYGQILPPDLLDLPRYGCLNVHTSLLPKYRGAAPIQWAIANGDTVTGVTIMKMDVGLDTGPIVSQRYAPIQLTDDAATLHDRLAQLGAELLVQTIPDYVTGNIEPRPQPADGVSHAPKIKKEHGRIDWTLPAETIRNRLRAFLPWPGAFTFLPEPPTEGQLSAPAAGPASKSHLLKIWRAETVEDAGEAGTILSLEKNNIIIACGQDALKILELQPEGGRRMNAMEFLAGHTLKVGERFA